MRFLILTQYFAPEIGAPQARYQGFINELIVKGHEVEVITAMPNYPHGRIAEQYRGSFYLKEKLFGATIHRFWLFPAMGAGLKRLLNYFSFVFTALGGAFTCKRPDLIFVESPPLFLAICGWLLALRWSCEWALNIADLWPDSVIELGLIKPGLTTRMVEYLEKWAYKKATYIIAVTEGIKADLIDRKQVPNSKILFLPNGADIQLFSPRPASEKIKTELKTSSNQRILLYAGTLGFAQGLSTAVQAMHELKNRGRLDIFLVFMGDGSAREELEKQANKLQLSNVTFISAKPLEQVAEVIAAADLVLVSLMKAKLLRGARPSKIFPALASGKPVIFVGEGEAAELINSANAGWVIPPDDALVLAETIEIAMANPEALLIKGQNGRVWVESNYNWARIVSDWLSELHLKRAHQ